MEYVFLWEGLDVGDQFELIPYLNFSFMNSLAFTGEHSQSDNVLIFVSDLQKN